MIIQTFNKVCHFTLANEDIALIAPYTDFFVHGAKLIGHNDLSFEQLTLAGLFMSFRHLGRSGFLGDHGAFYNNTESHNRYPRCGLLHLDRPSMRHVIMFRTEYLREVMSSINWKLFAEELDKRVPGRGETTESLTRFMSLISAWAVVDERDSPATFVGQTHRPHDVSGLPYRRWIESNINSVRTTLAKIYTRPIDTSGIDIRIKKFISTLGGIRKVSDGLVAKVFAGVTP